MSRRIDYAAMTEKKCNSCGTVKPVSEFHKYNDPTAPLTGWRYHSRCVSCNKDQCREYGQRGKIKRNSRLRTWRAANPEKAAALDRRKRLAGYGLTEAQFAAMHEAQAGRCLICDKKKPLVIDHCHGTGRVRGLLCSYCNTGVGWVETQAPIDRIGRYLAHCHADVLLELAKAPLPAEKPCHVDVPLANPVDEAHSRANEPAAQRHPILELASRDAAPVIAAKEPLHA
jgi:hypothetical protein